MTNDPEYDESFFEGNLASTLFSARAVVPRIVELVHPESVVDVGCGSGGWLSVFADIGVRDLLGIDGAYASSRPLAIPQDRFVAYDLTQPLSLPRSFDLGLCLEVAEHLPPATSGQLVHGLCRIAPVILFSAAPPLQPGVRHVNTHWPSFWAELFDREGFLTFDFLRTEFWNRSEVSFWYSQNMLLFVERTHLDPSSRLAHERPVPAYAVRRRIHPRLVSDGLARLVAEPRVTMQKVLSLAGNWRA